MPNFISTLFFSVGCIASLALLFLIFRQYFSSRQQFYPKRIITAYEAKMFTRLKQSFPEYDVLAQVAFSALITNKNYKVRAKFNRKVTDFVIIDRHTNVIAIVELDDPSHIGKEKEDAERDAMLFEAGYIVYRYTEIPSVQVLRKDIMPNKSKSFLNTLTG
ncbi:DUF2726 domain-containing protein [Acinetobacter equi]|uniref:DUF2726 domain-containing protein n=1 Tax=Acinetobacter equi TaxID=1324350 RepID=A0A0N9W1Y0_9GAMM|nr:DUF2726 domain-containing protein [Acinetobacter equi]ALH96694.1 hypothetical protein AOY20_08100 [Acinetobacter equi]